MQYEIVSADSHIIEPPDLWEKWLSPEFNKRAPKLVNDDEGGDAWDPHDGEKPMTIGLVTKTRGKSYEELRWGGSRYDTINQGCFEATARVEEMQEGGGQLQVIYPPQRTMRHFMLDEDKEFHRAGVQGYNDWLAKGFVGKAPDHFVGQGQIPNLGIDEAVAGVKRRRAMGPGGVVSS